MYGYIYVGIYVWVYMCGYICVGIYVYFSSETKLLLAREISISIENIIFHLNLHLF